MKETQGINEEKKTLLVISSVVIGVFLFWLLCINTVSPGYVGVVNNLLGDEKGIQPDIKTVGIHVTAPWKTIYRFPVFEQNHTWEEEERFNFQTSEGMSILAEVGITYHLKPENVPIIFQKYRRGMHEITNIFIRNYIRDAITKAASKFKIEDLYSNGKESFFEHVEKNIREQLEPIGIIVSRIYLIGKFHFPENVITALNAKIEANQRAQQRENELREAEAEAKKKVAAAEGEAKCILLKANSEAKANSTLASSITAELIQWQSLKKWDGKLPQVTGSTVPFINLDKLHK